MWGGNYCSEGVEGGVPQEHVVGGASMYHEVVDRDRLDLPSFTEGGVEVYIPSRWDPFLRKAIYGLVIGSQVLYENLQLLKGFPV